jgi:ABC-type phosphate transport system auxiliary subunit
MKYVIAFFRFWYDFIVGDDWRIAVGVLAAIGLTALVAHRGLAAWWVMVVSVVAVLVVSVRHGARS